MGRRVRRTVLNSIICVGLGVLLMGTGYAADSAREEGPSELTKKLFQRSKEPDLRLRIALSQTGNTFRFIFRTPPALPTKYRPFIWGIIFFYC